MSLHESGEMYLESIYVLCKTKSAVRSIDVAEYMNYSKPSVSRAVGLLKSQDLLTVDREGYLSLTELGTARAQKIYERHTVLSQALVLLGVDEETAAEDACRIEHVISDKTFQALKAYIHSQPPACPLSEDA